MGGSIAASAGSRRLGTVLTMIGAVAGSAISPVASCERGRRRACGRRRAGPAEGYSCPECPRLSRASSSVSGRLGQVQLCIRSGYRARLGTGSKAPRRLTGCGNAGPRGSRRGVGARLGQAVAARSVVTIPAWSTLWTKVVDTSAGAAGTRRSTCGGGGGTSVQNRRWCFYWAWPASSMPRPRGARGRARRPRPPRGRRRRCRGLASPTLRRDGCEIVPYQRFPCAGRRC